VYSFIKGPGQRITIMLVHIIHNKALERAIQPIALLDDVDKFERLISTCTA
jgi:hypothetical protein